MDRRQFLAAGMGVLAGCRDQTQSRAVEGSTLSSLQPGAAPAAELSVQQAPILGINSHLLLEDDLRLARELGFTHIRSTLLTPLWRDHPTYPISAVENTERTIGYGFGLMYVVHNAYGPVFRSGEDSTVAASFTSTVEEMMTRMPAVEAWQLWNEQDVWVQAPFGSGTRPPRSAERVGANYGNWWVETYQRIKAAHPGALLVTGAPADHEADRWRPFLRGMLRTGMTADALAIHVYGDWERLRSRLGEVRQMVGSTVPIWVTECGAPPGDSWSPERQARVWESIIEGNERERLADRIYPYALQTDPNDPWYGVRNVDGTDRPVVAVLRARVAAGATRPR